MKTMINLITKEIYMTNDTMNKFMNLSNEVDSILANVEEKIQNLKVALQVYWRLQIN